MTVNELPVEPADTHAAWVAYLVHPLVLVAISPSARPLPWSPAAKFVLVAVAGARRCSRSVISSPGCPGCAESL
ncbi:hypothetical protein [Georgenia muralis]|uniref:Uncharacterized protein n=1 Tax=Georgenia muralis TaxID=154117 RepID=A0A3N4Z6V0_9MICO|nr:hypothetical protein [Georgenia muralis]RPF29139.1 hypothetical protein EDD32_3699 [Georgenia muralis]